MTKKLFAVFGFLFVAFPLQAQVCPGPTYVASTRDYQFTTRRFDTGVPATLGGSPVVKAYKGNSTTTEVTTGITLTADLEVTGQNNLRVDFSDAFYAAGSDIHFIITTGTVNSVSVVGEIICNVHLVAATATADIPDVNVKNVNNVAATSVTTINANLGSTQPVNFTGTGGSALVKDEVNGYAAGFTPTRPITTGTAQSGGSTSIVLASAENFTNDDQILCSLIQILSGTGKGQNKIITDYVNSSDTVTVDSAWATNPDSTSVYQITPFPCTIAAALIVDNIWDELLSGHTTSGTTGKKLSDIPTSTFSAIDTGTAQAGSTGTTLVLKSASAFANDELNGLIVCLTGGTGYGQCRAIDDYVGSTDTATVATWTTTPDNTSTYALLGFFTISSGGNLVDLVWDELLSGHTTTGTAGKKLGDLPATIILPKNTATSGNRISFFSVGTNGQFTTGASGVACTISLDGGTEASVTDTPAENEFGSDASTWSFDLTQAETNANQANIICTGTAMRPAALHLEFQQ